MFDFEVIPPTPPRQFAPKRDPRRDFTIHSAVLGDYRVMFCSGFPDNNFVAIYSLIHGVTGHQLDQWRP